MRAADSLFPRGSITQPRADRRGGEVVDPTANQAHRVVARPHLRGPSTVPNVDGVALEAIGQLRLACWPGLQTVILDFPIDGSH
jgi:hypothetical protein